MDGAVDEGRPDLIACALLCFGNLARTGLWLLRRQVHSVLLTVLKQNIPPPLFSSLPDPSLYSLSSDPFSEVPHPSKFSMRSSAC